MEKEVLRLFKGFLGEKSNSVSEEGLKYGLLVPSSASETVVKEAIELYGKDGQKWNQTFHKDFEIVRNAPIEDLIAQQIMHYITTYGFESLGIYREDLVYIPKEKLEIPELDVDNIELITIKPYTSEQLTEKLMGLLTSGIALSEQTVKDVMVLSDFIDKNRFDEIVNREIKTTLYDKYNIMPRNPEEFLRFLLFKLTNGTLKIQNADTIRAIKKSDKAKALNMLQLYVIKTPNGYEKLSSIFLRNKNLFLALKIKQDECRTEKDEVTRKSINALINKLRKMANSNHKPLKRNILDCLTDTNVNINVNELCSALDNVTIFREIRILNGILYRLYGNNNVVYKIRNGKSYVTNLPPKTQAYIKKLEDISQIIKTHLVDRISTNVKGKYIYIPNNITYAAPTSEKQFNGNIPAGSYIEVPRIDDLVYGVHWTNLPGDGKYQSRGFYGEIKPKGEERVDLDLKQMNKNEVFGWDASYRSSASDILFSGDITDAPAPNGATELFYVGRNYGHGAFLITLNMFTSNTKDVPFEFVLAKAPANSSAIRKNYAINPNDIIEKIDMEIKNTERQKVLGLITIGDTVKFYFNDFSAGGDVRTPKGCSTSTRNSITMGSFDYLRTYNMLQLKLNDLLKDAGAIVIDQPQYSIVQRTVMPDGTSQDSIQTMDADIDLSLSNITKDSLIHLLSGN